MHRIVMEAIRGSTFRFRFLNPGCNILPSLWWTSLQGAPISPWIPKSKHDCLILMKLYGDNNVFWNLLHLTSSIALPCPFLYSSRTNSTPKRGKPLNPIVQGWSPAPITDNFKCWIRFFKYVIKQRSSHGPFTQFLAFKYCLRYYDYHRKVASRNFAICKLL